MARTLSELREHIVGEWKFDGNFLDSSGNENHGVPTDVEWVPTERGMKPLTNGTLSPIVLDESIVFSVNQTISFWAKLQNDVPYQGIFGPVWGYQSYMRFNAPSNRMLLFETDINDDAGSLIFDNLIEYGEWNNFTIVRDGTNWYLYLNGIKQADEAITTASNLTFKIIGNGRGRTDVSFLSFDNFMKIDTILDATEAQLLYNSTKTAYGVQPAERSFSHDVGAVLGTPDNAVFCTDMHTKNSDGTLVDLSGNGNDGTIYGAARESGYFKDGIRFNGVNNTIVIDDDDVFDAQEFHIKVIFVKLGTLSTAERLISKTDGTSVRQFDAHITTSNRLGFNFGDTDVYSDNMIASDKMCVVDCILYNSELYIYTNGILDSVHDYDVIVPYTDTDMYIGNFEGLSRYFNGTIYMVTIATSIPSESDVGGEYNKLAVLPLYELDCSKLPANTTTFTTGEFLPNSSIHVNSGEFQIVSDAGYNQIKCVSSGSLRLLPAWEWDGDEYLTLTVDGETYSGTGTITQGTVTASISQDSTAITVNMAAGDVLDKLDIQFRRPV